MKLLAVLRTHQRPGWLLCLVLLLAIAMLSCVRTVPGATAPKATATSAVQEMPDLQATLTAFAFNATETSVAGMPFEFPTPATAFPVTPPAGVTPPAQPTTEPPAQPTAEPPVQPTQPPAVLPTAPPPSVVQPQVAPAAEAAPPAVYKLRKGEFPYCIARRFDVNPRWLMRVNGLYYWQIFRVGQRLVIPPGAPPFPGRRALHPHPATYWVQPGDTLWSVACYYGDIDPLAIAAANGLTPPYRLHAGTVLTIP